MQSASEGAAEGVAEGAVENGILHTTSDASTHDLVITPVQQLLGPPGRLPQPEPPQLPQEAAQHMYPPQHVSRTPALQY